MVKVVVVAVVLCECCLVVVRWVVVAVGSACKECCLAVVGLACCMSVDLQVVNPVSPEPTYFGMSSGNWLPTTVQEKTDKPS